MHCDIMRKSFLKCILVCACDMLCTVLQIQTALLVIDSVSVPIGIRW